jgi:transposase
MSFLVGVDVSKEKFDACCIDEQGEKLRKELRVTQNEGRHVSQNIL